MEWPSYAILCWFQWHKTTRNITLPAIPWQDITSVWSEALWKLIALPKNTTQLVVTYLYKNIQHSQRDNDSQKYGCGKAYREYWGDDGEERPQERWHAPRHHIINATDVLREAVHDSPLWSGLKKRHRWVQNVVQHSLMKIAGRYYCSSRQS